MEPYLVVNAPKLNDDFYLNPIDWSSRNVLAVILNHTVHLWNVCEDGNNPAIPLSDGVSEQDGATSLQWSEDGEKIAVGKYNGCVELWDVETQSMLCEWPSHQARVGCIAWNENSIVSGSRDRRIIHRDIREPEQMNERLLENHMQEVCSLKWSPDRRHLASGGNDNVINVWSMHRANPLHSLTEHNAAIKALAWSPHHRGLIVSGGGTADRCLRLWDTLTGMPMQRIEVGSQISNVAWSKDSPEFVTTHGYYSNNEVNRWTYPILRPETIASHPNRVLYMALSPDGQSIVTGGADETLRFYDVFSRNPRTTSTHLTLDWDYFHRVFDAPGLQHDFYQNSLDWSSQNIVAVGLLHTVYLESMNEENSTLVELCNLEDDRDLVLSVQWNESGDFLAVGTSLGNTQIWDVRAQRMVAQMNKNSRVSSLAWNDNVVCSGCYEGSIFMWDIRNPLAYKPLLGHTRRQVCGLKWSPDRQYLASGGNDNQLIVWNMRHCQPCQTYTEHSAAVKAIAWSPHHRGLLASGGGALDKCIRFWDTLTGQPMQRIDTDSQVSNVAWSKNSHELVSTHGNVGALANQAVTWKYPLLQPENRMDHPTRVLYMAMSPDGESIVTGGEDEKLRFWRVFSS